MITISSAVKQIVEESFLIEEGLNRDLINLSSLAREMKPKIISMTKKTVKDNAIVVALKRISIQIRSENKIRHSIFKTAPEIILRSNLTTITYAKSQTLLTGFDNLLDVLRSNSNLFLALSYGVFETGITINHTFCHQLELKLKSEKVVKKVDNLSAITIILPEENIHVPGVYYDILKILAWNKINIIDIVSTYRELTIIISNSQIDEAFSSLKKLFIK